MPQSDLSNIASRMSMMASLTPSAVAIAQPSGPPVPAGERGYDVTTFGELDQRTDRIARGLVKWGIRPGDRLVMLVPFGGEFIQLVFGLLKAGATMVLIDPGINKKHLVQCLADARPDGFVGIPKAQLIRSVLRRRFPDARWNVTVGRRYLWGGRTLAQIEEMGRDESITLPQVQLADPAAVIFTTGSTGPPKGVLFTHATFHAQVDRIRDRYDIHRGSRDLACFPLFGLFDAVMGVTTIIPDMDPTRPADVNPARLVEAVRQWDIDQAFGSPALWKTVVRWCDEKQVVGRPFESLRRVLSAGAPVPASTLEKLRAVVHPDADIVTPYGATEALPIASIESRQVITETGPAADKGKGVCVGTRFENVRWKVIAIRDEPIESFDDIEELPRRKIGELMVTGPMVTQQYVVRADQNAYHKVIDADQVVWHRMGDVGYLDEEDRFWFCGRKAHRVVTAERTLFTIPCEAVFNSHPSVYRSALVGRGSRPNQTPVVLIEVDPSLGPRTTSQQSELIDALKALAARNPITRRITDIRIRREPMPVDIRHNSKIFREQLTAEVNG
ncbi:fatty acid CoA ligase family protein [Crateriforma conspicua]|uniref:Long-chain-fatty-acid--CoA ligase n=1 Tax=Crateriforma conspicua TaxID=2527996 RepID=A0A5C6FYQ8_9PLAN|nr:fatty acid CoA ligase family protein [Crateriforma conspicua]TWU67464.1 Long-chain-fatty-acid--CoA ligase [Crateriforma conspicua]